MGETTKRVISSAILVPLLVFCIHYAGWYYLQLYALGVVLVILGLTEFYRFADKGDDGKPFVKSGMVFGIFIFTVYYFQLLGAQKQLPVPPEILSAIKYFQNPNAYVIPMFLILFIWSFILQILTRPLEGAIHSVSTTIVGVVYLSVTMGHFLVIMAYDYGIFYIWLVAGLTFITDGGAYFGGRWFGRHPAGLKISPKKTWEGYITGIITATIYTIGLKLTWEHFSQTELPFSIAELLIFTPVFSLISVVGDLAESAMKRDAKIKDSSSVIPGHGGVLDLVDAVIITLPCSYFYLSAKASLGFVV